eukprot:jgi/Mesvir1/28742/Mv19710-RA.1
MAFQPGLRSSGRGPGSGSKPDSGFKVGFEPRSYGQQTLGAISKDHVFEKGGVHERRPSDKSSALSGWAALPPREGPKNSPGPGSPLTPKLLSRPGTSEPKSPSPASQPVKRNSIQAPSTPTSPAASLTGAVGACGAPDLWARPTSVQASRDLSSRLRGDAVASSGQGAPGSLQQVPTTSQGERITQAAGLTRPATVEPQRAARGVWGDAGGGSAEEAARYSTGLARPTTTNSGTLGKGEHARGDGQHGMSSPATLLSSYERDWLFQGISTRAASQGANRKGQKEEDASAGGLRAWSSESSWIGLVKNGEGPPGSRPLKLGLANVAAPGTSAATRAALEMQKARVLASVAMVADTEVARRAGVAVQGAIDLAGGHREVVPGNEFVTNLGGTSDGSIKGLTPGQSDARPATPATHVPPLAPGHPGGVGWPMDGSVAMRYRWPTAGMAAGAAVNGDLFSSGGYPRAGVDGNGVDWAAQGMAYGARPSESRDGSRQPLSLPPQAPINVLPPQPSSPTRSQSVPTSPLRLQPQPQSPTTLLATPPHSPTRLQMQPHSSTQTQQQPHTPTSLQLALAPQAVPSQGTAESRAGPPSLFSSVSGAGAPQGDVGDRVPPNAGTRQVPGAGRVGSLVTSMLADTLLRGEHSQQGPASSRQPSGEAVAPAPTVWRPPTSIRIGDTAVPAKAAGSPSIAGSPGVGVAGTESAEVKPKAKGVVIPALKLPTLATSDGPEVRGKAKDGATPAVAVGAAAVKPVLNGDLFLEGSEFKKDRIDEDDDGNDDGDDDNDVLGESSSSAGGVTGASAKSTPKAQPAVTAPALGSPLRTPSLAGTSRSASKDAGTLRGSVTGVSLNGSMAIPSLMSRGGRDPVVYVPPQPARDGDSTDREIEHYMSCYRREGRRVWAVTTISRAWRAYQLRRRLRRYRRLRRVCKCRATGPIMYAWRMLVRSIRLADVTLLRATFRAWREYKVALDELYGAVVRGINRSLASSGSMPAIEMWRVCTIAAGQKDVLALSTAGHRPPSRTGVPPRTPSGALPMTGGVMGSLSGGTLSRPGSRGTSLGGTGTLGTGMEAKGTLTNRSVDSVGSVGSVHSDVEGGGGALTPLEQRQQQQMGLGDGELEPTGRSPSITMYLQVIIARQIPFRYRLMCFRIWRAYRAFRLDRRAAGAARVRAFSRKFFLRTVSKALRFWHRFALVKIGSRDALTLPSFPQDLPCFDAWFWGHVRRRLYERQSYVLQGIAWMGRAFNLWRSAVRIVRAEHALEDTAIGHRTRTLQTFVIRRLLIFRELCRMERRMMAIVLTRWAALTVRNHNRRVLCAHVAVQHGKRLCTDALKRLRQHAKYQKLVAGAATLQLLENSYALQAALMGLQGHARDTHRWFLRCWKRWASRAVARVRWHRYLAVHCLVAPLRLLSVAMDAWKLAHAQRKSVTFVAPTTYSGSTVSHPRSYDEVMVVEEPTVLEPTVYNCLRHHHEHASPTCGEPHSAVVGPRLDVMLARANAANGTAPVMPPNKVALDSFAVYTAWESRRSLLLAWQEGGIPDVYLWRKVVALLGQHEGRRHLAELTRGASWPGELELHRRDAVLKGDEAAEQAAEVALAKAKLQRAVDARLLVYNKLLSMVGCNGIGHGHILEENEDVDLFVDSADKEAKLKAWGIMGGDGPGPPSLDERFAGRFWAIVDNDVRYASLLYNWRMRRDDGLIIMREVRYLARTLGRTVEGFTLEPMSVTMGIEESLRENPLLLAHKEEEDAERGHMGASGHAHVGARRSDEADMSQLRALVGGSKQMSVEEAGRIISSFVAKWRSQRSSVRAGTTNSKNAAASGELLRHNRSMGPQSMFMLVLQQEHENARRIALGELDGADSDAPTPLPTTPGSPAVAFRQSGVPGDSTAAGSGASTPKHKFSVAEEPTVAELAYVARRERQIWNLVLSAYVRLMPSFQMMAADARGAIREMVAAAAGTGPVAKATGPMRPLTAGGKVRGERPLGAAMPKASELAHRITYSVRDQFQVGEYNAHFFKGVDDEDVQAAARVKAAAEEAAALAAQPSPATSSTPKSPKRKSKVGSPRRSLSPVRRSREGSQSQTKEGADAGGSSGSASPTRSRERPLKAGATPPGSPLAKGPPSPLAPKGGLDQATGKGGADQLRARTSIGGEKAAGAVVAPVASASGGVSVSDGLTISTTAAAASALSIRAPDPGNAGALAQGQGQGLESAHPQAEARTPPSVTVPHLQFGMMGVDASGPGSGQGSRAGPGGQVAAAGAPGTTGSDAAAGPASGVAGMGDRATADAAASAEAVSGEHGQVKAHGSSHEAPQRPSLPTTAQLRQTLFSLRAGEKLQEETVVGGLAAWVGAAARKLSNASLMGGSDAGSVASSKHGGHKGGSTKRDGGSERSWGGAEEEDTLAAREADARAAWEHTLEGLRGKGHGVVEPKNLRELLASDTHLSLLRRKERPALLREWGALVAQGSQVAVISQNNRADVLDRMKLFSPLSDSPALEDDDDGKTLFEEWEASKDAEEERPFEDIAFDLFGPNFKNYDKKIAKKLLEWGAHRNHGKDASAFLPAASDGLDAVAHARAKEKLAYAKTVVNVATTTNYLLRALEERRRNNDRSELMEELYRLMGVEEEGEGEDDISGWGQSLKGHRTNSRHLHDAALLASIEAHEKEMERIWRRQESRKERLARRGQSGWVGEERGAHGKRGWGRGGGARGGPPWGAYAAWGVTAGAICFTHREGISEDSLGRPGSFSRSMSDTRGRRLRLSRRPDTLIIPESRHPPVHWTSPEGSGLFDDLPDPRDWDDKDAGDLEDQPADGETTHRRWSKYSSQTGTPRLDSPGWMLNSPGRGLNSPGGSRPGSRGGDFPPISSPRVFGGVPIISPKVKSGMGEPSRRKHKSGKSGKKGGRKSKAKNEGHGTHRPSAGGYGVQQWGREAELGHVSDQEVEDDDDPFHYLYQGYGVVEEDEMMDPPTPPADPPVAPPPEPLPKPKPKRKPKPAPPEPVKDSRPKFTFSKGTALPPREPRKFNVVDKYVPPPATTWRACSSGNGDAPGDASRASTEGNNNNPNAATPDATADATGGTSNASDTPSASSTVRHVDWEGRLLTLPLLSKRLFKEQVGAEHGRELRRYAKKELQRQIAQMQWEAHAAGLLPVVHEQQQLMLAAELAAEGTREALELAHQARRGTGTRLLLSLRRSVMRKDTHRPYERFSVSDGSSADWEGSDVGPAEAGSTGAPSRGSTPVEGPTRGPQGKGRGKPLPRTQPQGGQLRAERSLPNLPLSTYPDTGNPPAQLLAGDPWSSPQSDPRGESGYSASDGGPQETISPGASNTGASHASLEQALGTSQYAPSAPYGNASYGRAQQKALGGSAPPRSVLLRDPNEENQRLYQVGSMKLAPRDPGASAAGKQPLKRQSSSGGGAAGFVGPAAAAAPVGPAMEAEPSGSAVGGGAEVGAGPGMGHASARTYSSADPNAGTGPNAVTAGLTGLGAGAAMSDALYAATVASWNNGTTPDRSSDDVPLGESPSRLDLHSRKRMNRSASKLGNK